VLQARVRRPGAGPKRRIDVDPDVLVVLDSLVDPESRGDRMSPLRWTLKSTRKLAEEMNRLGYKMGANLTGELLHYLRYSADPDHDRNPKTPHESPCRDPVYSTPPRARWR
jgi:hypothetical protein